MRKIKNAVQKRSTPSWGRYRAHTCTSLRCAEQEDAVVGKIVAMRAIFWIFFAI